MYEQGLKEELFSLTSLEQLLHGVPSTETCSWFGTICVTEIGTEEPAMYKQGSSNILKVLE